MTAAAHTIHPNAGARSRWSAGRFGGIVLLLIALPCFVTLPWSLDHYKGKAGDEVRQRQGPSLAQPLGTDALGRSLMWRSLLGGAISLMIGLAAATIAVVIGVSWGAAAGLAGGWVDAALMRTVDVLFGLPYILLVVLLDIALSPVVELALASDVVEAVGGRIYWLFTLGRENRLPSDFAPTAADVVTLLIAIGGLSWLVMARVIRGQVLSLRALPFVEAARAAGVGPIGIGCRHMLPNLIGPIVVYAALTVPTAILAESTLSFLGIGVQAPLPSWGNLASEGLEELHALARRDASAAWWLIAWPCVLLAGTLLALNFLGDALRERFDPRGR